MVYRNPELRHPEKHVTHLHHDWRFGMQVRTAGCPTTVLSKTVGLHLTCLHGPTAARLHHLTRSHSPRSSAGPVPHCHAAGRRRSSHKRRQQRSTLQQLVIVRGWGPAELICNVLCVCVCVCVGGGGGGGTPSVILLFWQ